MADTWAYVIAHDEAQAREVAFAWMYAAHPQRRLMEAMDICFKGEADARALVPKHGDNRPRVWRVTIGVEPVEESVKMCSCGRPDPGACDPCPFKMHALHCACVCEDKTP